MAGTDEADVLDVKIDPELGSILWEQAAYLPGYHMNKEHWLAILLDQVTDKEALQLLDGSYHLVTKGNA
ncbi:MmcQ/YjbR family DNA-binding protein [Levilactobacillus tujiorum]|uniref:MmcQ/YjbR family DNA-binding protein n=1 Tax=Levilactobacillus tujiorum TaxID=2912243 RepID=UPI001F11B273|nr:MmcQ/YjbR family DNA-binding protein [Levilactobacillus tujiorum]MCH5465544.1 MmcQ/YjbR family DNA-binding protein [Levilactobacillus tujiorum]